MALTKIQAAGLTADLIDETKLADNSIDSEHYNDGSIDNAHLADDAVGVAELSATGTASSSTFLRGDNSWVTPTDTNTQLSTEQVQDIVGGMFTGNTETNITATYEDGDGTIDLVASGGGETNRMPLAGGTFTGDVIFDNATNAGKDLTWDMSDDSLEFADNTKAVFGDGGDLKIYHNGTDNYIMPSNGKLIINNGSETLAEFSNNGAVELYYDNSKKLETTNTGAWCTGNFTLGADDNKLRLGTHQDLDIYHGGDVNIILNNNSRNLEIKHGSDLALRTFNDGAVELYYDNVKKFETIATGVVITGSDDGDAGVKGDFKFFQADGTLKAMWDASVPALEFTDGAKATFGAGDDLKVFHNTHNYITYTGADLLITGDATNQIKLMPKSDEAAIVCKPNAEVELYYDGGKKFETTSDGVKVTDNVKILAGTSNPLEIYRDGSDSYIKNHDGDLYINANGTEEGVTLIQNGGVELHYNGTKTFETVSGGVKVPDAKYSYWGDSDDMWIGHNGTNSYIDNNTGTFYITTTGSGGTIEIGSMLGCNIKVADGEYAMSADANGSIEYYYDGSKKFNTTSTGTYTTGTHSQSGSDIRLKENIVNITNATDKLKQLQGFNFNFNSTGLALGLNPVNEIGLSAQDVQKVAPEVVGTIPETGYLTVNYEKLVPILIESIKELSTEIETLKTKVAALEAA